MPKHVLDAAAIPSDKEGDPPIVLLPEHLYADDHPYVKKYPSLFVEAWDESEVRAVEEATATPGQKRTTSRK